MEDDYGSFIWLSNLLLIQLPPVSLLNSVSQFRGWRDEEKKREEVQNQQNEILMREGRMGTEFLENLKRRTEAKSEKKKRIFFFWRASHCFGLKIENGSVWSWR